MTTPEMEPCYGQESLGMNICTSGEASPAVLSHLGRVCTGCLLQERGKLDQRISDLEQDNTKLLRESTTDPLTQLNNRTAFERTLREKMNNNEPFGLLFIDLTKFGTVNIRMGHDRGDYYLMLTAEFLKDQLRAADISRFGGDEFCVVLSNDTDSNEQRTTYLALAERVSIVEQRLVSEYEKQPDIAQYNQENKGIDELTMHMKSAIWKPGMSRQQLLMIVDPKRRGELPLEFQNGTIEVA